jgi:hypothetical protein
MDLDARYSGYSHYSLEVELVNDEIDYTETAGIKSTKGPITFNDGNTSTFIRDPDINVIELFAPQAALESMFGISFNGTQNIIIRSWSALVGLIGATLAYGFFSHISRVFIISVAAFSKVVFVSLILL